MTTLRQQQQLPDHEVQERFQDIVEQEQRAAEQPEALSVERRPIRWMRWVAGFLILAVAAGAAAFVMLRDGGTETTTDSAVQAPVLEVAPTYPDGYWNGYLNEWVEYDVAPTYPDGYWNGYLNEWVEYGD